MEISSLTSNQPLAGCVTMQYNNRSDPCLSVPNQAQSLLALSPVDSVKLVVLVNTDDMDDMANRDRTSMSKWEEKRKVLEEQALSHLFIRNIDYLIDNIQSSKENIQTALDQIANDMTKDINHTDLRSLNREKFAEALGLVSYKVTDNQILAPAPGKSTNENTTNTFPEKNTEERKNENTKHSFPEQNAKDLLDSFWFCGRPCGQLGVVEESETPKRNE